MTASSGRSFNVLVQQCAIASDRFMPEADSNSVHLISDCRACMRVLTGHPCGCVLPELRYEGRVLFAR